MLFESSYNAARSNFQSGTRKLKRARVRNMAAAWALAVGAAVLIKLSSSVDNSNHRVSRVCPGSPPVSFYRYYADLAK